MGKLKKIIKKILRATVPLSMRKGVIIWLNKQEWINLKTRYWWTVEALRDFAQKDTDEYHKYLWNNHLAYAETYDIEKRFGDNGLELSRQFFFDELEKQLKNMNLKPDEDIHSVFELGCSLGYQLRFMEQSLFPAASILRGIDIDRYAIQQGQQFLKGVGSRVEIDYGDMEKLDDLLVDQKFDIFIATGVLLYLNENSTKKIIRKMLDHTNVLVALSGLAYFEEDNKNLVRSKMRERDQTFIHNFDSMISNEGGKVIFRRWEGDKMYNGHTIYFVFGVPLH